MADGAAGEFGIEIVAGRVVVTGELDAMTSPQLADALAGMAEVNPSEVVVDCSQVGFIDSAGLSVLVAAHGRLDALGGRLVISGMSAPVRRLFSIAGIDRVLTIDE